MGRLALRAIFVYAVTLGITFAAPFHALAMQQPCAQMTVDASVAVVMEKAGETIAASVDAGGSATEGPVAMLIEMDCTQHCSDMGTSVLLLDSSRHAADDSPAGGTASLALVFPELDPSPPRAGTVG